MPKREAQIEASLLTPGDVIKIQGHERLVVSVRAAFSAAQQGEVFQVVRMQTVTDRGSGAALYDYVFHFTEQVTLVIGDE